MMRRVLTVVSVFLIGMFGAVGLAAAAPPYPAPPTVTVNVTINGSTVTGNITVIVGGTIIFSGDGFDPRERVDGNVSYLGPSGLRSTLAASSLAAAKASSAAADSNGHFSQELTLDQVGTAVLTATGQSSGKSGSITVEVVPAGATGAGATTIAAAAGAGSSDGGAGLARTGVSIAGPLVVGLATLLVGLALLFFGTRGVIRRKTSKSLGDA